MEKIKKFGLVLGAGAIAFIIFSLSLLGLSFFADYLKNNIGLEPWLFLQSLLKPIALVFVGSWMCIAGKFLNKIKLITYGRNLLILWVIMAIVPYFLSFLVTPHR